MQAKEVLFVLLLIAFSLGKPATSYCQQVITESHPNYLHIPDSLDHLPIDSLFQGEVLPADPGKLQTFLKDRYNARMPVYRPDTFMEFYIREKRRNSDRHFYLRRWNPSSNMIRPH